jgi:hypothetical protein
MKILHALSLLTWLASATAVVSGETILPWGEVLNHYPGGRQRQLQGSFSQERLAGFVKAVDAVFKSSLVRGAAYAFRGPVSWTADSQHCCCTVVMTHLSNLLAWIPEGNDRSHFGVLWEGCC